MAKMMKGTGDDPDTAIESFKRKFPAHWEVVVEYVMQIWPTI